jgi:ornithine cyclodeaminase/alanine dehydrogenase-like protein (mu-crystallin family)
VEHQRSPFPPLLISSADLVRSGIELDPRALHDRAAQMWRDIGTAQSTGKKSVLLPPESAFWALPQHAGLRQHFKRERLGWKLSTLTAANGKLASVKIVGANAANRFLGHPRSCSTILLLDALTMRPVCLLEGTDISAARTATYATLVGKAILSRRPSASVFLFGGGPIARSICLALDAVLGPRLDNLWVRTRSLATAETFVQSLGPIASTTLAVADNARLREADLVITASNAKFPLFTESEIGPKATVLHLGGDETPSEFVSHALKQGTVVCDDIAMVSARNSQSIALHFSRRGSSLEAEAQECGLRELPAYLAAVGDETGPTHITCVGVPSLDLYVAQYIYETYLAAAAPPATGLANDNARP